MKILSPINENKDIVSKKYVDDGLSSKQTALVSGTNIKTINNESLLGSGNITISGSFKTREGYLGDDILYFYNGLTSLDYLSVTMNNIEWTLPKLIWNIAGNTLVEGDYYWNILEALCNSATIDPSTIEIDNTTIFITYPGFIYAYLYYDSSTYKITDVELIIYENINGGGQYVYGEMENGNLVLSDNRLHELVENKVTSLSSSSTDTQYPSAKLLYDQLATKQASLVSGTNIKTINNESLLGSGNITISGGGTATDVQINGTSIVNNDVANIITQTAYNSSSNKIATMSDLPSVSDRLKIYPRSAYNLNTCYDAGVYLVAQGSNIPSGSNYGSLLVMPYRKADGNTTPDFATQIFMPNGDDNTHPNSFYYRTALSGSWNNWQELETTTNRVTSISSSSTDTQYPSAKCVYDLIGDVESLLGGI